jgi:hypothetical protein
MITRFKSLKTLVATAAIAQCLGGTLLAQAGSGSKCDKAAAVVSQGRVPAQDDSVFNSIRGCGAVGGRAIAAGVAHFATETDIPVLEDFMSQVDQWRDESVFRATTQLATNDAASPQARVFAVRHLFMLLRPELLYSYQGLTRKADTTVTPELTSWQSVGCAGAIITSPHGSSRGAPLPTDFKAEIRSTLKSIAQSASAPNPVRYAALCALAQS